jgi:hypothetical protein
MKDLFLKLYVKVQVLKVALVRDERARTLSNTLWWSL